MMKNVIKVLLIPALLVVAGLPANAKENDGTVRGNGCCYETTTGNYCGKGGGGATGSACTCGSFMAPGPAPSPGPITYSPMLPPGTYSPVPSGPGTSLTGPAAIMPSHN